MKETEKQKIREGYQNITKKLIQTHRTITGMESATAGLIASLLTDTEGSSAILKGAFVTYSNEAKIKQGVDPAIIETYGVYSSETAAAMAAACRGCYSADIGIGITGTFGNTDPANQDSVPGQIYFSINVNGKSFDFFRELSPQPDRLSYKYAAAGEILKELVSLI